MFKPIRFIKEICPTCHPHGYELSLAKFTGEKNIVEASNADESYVEYLYECCQCGARVWVDDQWVKRNAVESTSVEALYQRQLYISQKGRQLDTITDAHKYSQRLARIMRYHKLLTDVEMATVKKLIKVEVKTMTRIDAIELWERDFDNDHPDLEVIVEYAESQGFTVED